MEYLWSRCTHMCNFQNHPPLDIFGWFLYFSFLFYKCSEKLNKKANRCHVKKKKELHIHLHLRYRILDETIYKVIKALFILFLRLV